LQGRQHSYFCGAWAGYGFHEDGLKSGMQAARQLLADWARQTPPVPAQALA
jgi:predicted NAD/FAD-binding protein